MVAPVPAELEEQGLRDLATEILDVLRQRRVRGLVLDMAQVELIDSAAFASLKQLVEATMLMGSQVVLVGLQPGVASVLSELDISTTNLRFARTVDHALARMNCQRPTGASAGR